MKLRHPPPASATRVALKFDFRENRNDTARFLWSTVWPKGQGQVIPPRFRGSIGLSQPNPTLVAVNMVRPSTSCSTSTSLFSSMEYSSNPLTYNFSTLGLHPSEADPSRSKNEKWNCLRMTDRPLAESTNLKFTSAATPGRTITLPNLDPPFPNPPVTWVLEELTIMSKGRPLTCPSSRYRMGSGCSQMLSAASASTFALKKSIAVMSSRHGSVSSPSKSLGVSAKLANPHGGGQRLWSLRCSKA
mmetsp:Transcript_89559/g.248713  ORF Transcript_89559/g.248713 Transcript_89559/m.248713 type:complete len:245 (+) Transcript_89559:684-1418(+)